MSRGPPGPSPVLDCTDAPDLSTMLSIDIRPSPVVMASRNAATGVPTARVTAAADARTSPTMLRRVATLPAWDRTGPDSPRRHRRRWPPRSSVSSTAGSTTTNATGSGWRHSSPATRLKPPAQPKVQEIGEITDVDVFPLEAPSDEQIVILEYLDSVNGANKKQLVEFSKDRELPYLADTTAKSVEALYRRLDTHIVEPLAADGYVRVRKAGREKVVELIDRGEGALRMFALGDEGLRS